jgi:hypothetical protein
MDARRPSGDALGLRDQCDPHLFMESRVLVEMGEHLVAALAELLTLVRVPGT